MAGASQFLARGNGYTLLLEPAEVVLKLKRSPVDLRMHLAGSSPSAKAEALEQLPGNANYLRGRDPQKWITDIPTYAQVRYKNVYPGTDLVYYGRDGRLEYDFVLSPRTKPDRIRLQFAGIDSFSISPSGSLLLETTTGVLEQQKPLVYQEIDGVRKEIEGQYVRAGHNAVGFRVGRYNTAKPLIIDPALSYSTFLGGSGADEGRGIAVNNLGNAYIVGTSFSTQGGDSDAFIIKLDPSGTSYVYSSTFGGRGQEEGAAIAIDSSGNAYITGSTDSTDLPLSGGIFQSSLAGNKDAYLAVLNSSGNGLVYATYLGGSNEDRGFGVELDSSGNVYVAGATASNDFPIGSNPYQQSNFGGFDGFLVKLSPSGSLIYSTYLGGSGDDRVFGLAVDSTGSAYLTGPTESDDFPLNFFSSALQGNRKGDADAFVTKMTPDGSGISYSTYLGGSGRDVGQAIVVDSAGNAYVTGSTISTDFPTRLALQPGSAGGMDAFVTKLDPTGTTLVWSTLLGGNGVDIGYGIALDQFNNVYVTGTTESTDFFLTNDANQSNRAGGTDVFLTKFTADGSDLLFSSYFGGGNDDAARSIAVDCTGAAYLTGRTASTDFPTTGNSPQTGYAGGSSDSFALKIPISSGPSVRGCAAPGARF